MKVLDILEGREIPTRLARQYEMRAEAEREAGGECEVEPRLPAISIRMSDGAEYFFQEHEAEEMLAKVPDNLHPEDYFLAQAQNW